MFFPILILSMYIVALIVTNKLDFNIDGLLNRTMKQDMEEFVSSKTPQSTADVDYWINEYMRKNRSFQ